MLTKNFIDTPAWGIGVPGPFAEIERFVQRMDRMLDEWMPSIRKTKMASTDLPLVNLSEDRERYLLRAAIPGVKSEDLDIRATTKSVSISGKHHIPEEGEGVSYHRRERGDRPFSRLVSLSKEIDPDQVDAKVENGVLILRLPKTEEFKTKQIPIKLS